LGQRRAKDVLAVLNSKKPVVVDADALTCFERNPKQLFDALHDNCVLTPHEGEFVRIFPTIQGTREERALMAAKQTGACVLLKGSKTLIASPDGRVVVNETGSADLATAGSGDVLSGMIGGLMAQGMPPFESACAGAYLHGLAGQGFGRGLVASDLPDLLPAILQDLIAS
jgi:ADP-dependent NAD(P)H-hydrate dehydratase / NAD(P)H-hydrate epimerase